MNAPALKVHTLIDFGSESLLLCSIEYFNSKPISVGEIKGGLMPEYMERANFLNEHTMITSVAADGTSLLLAAVLSPTLGNSVSRSLAVQFQNRSKLFSNVKSESVEKLSASDALKLLQPYSGLIDRLISNPNKRSENLASFYTKAKAAALVVRNPFVGKFDNVENGIAGGWLLNILNPNERYEVQLMDGMRIVAYGVADFFREDLLQAGKLDGRVAFRITIPASLYDGKEHPLTVRVKGRKDIAIPGVVKFKGGDRRAKPPLFQKLANWRLLELLLAGVSEETVWLEAFECYQKAWIDLEFGELTSATLYLQDLVSIGLDGLAIQLGLLQIEVQRGEFTLAHDRVQRLMETNPENPLVTYAAGVVHHANQRNDLAIRFIESALRNPEGLYDCLAHTEDLQEKLLDLGIDDDSIAKDQKIARLRKKLLKQPSNRELSERILELESPAAQLHTSGRLLDGLRDLQEVRHLRVLVDTLLINAARGYD